MDFTKSHDAFVLLFWMPHQQQFCLLTESNVFWFFLAALGNGYCQVMDKRKEYCNIH